MWQINVVVVVVVVQFTSHSTVEPPFNEPLYNEVLGITNDILQPGHSFIVKCMEQNLDIMNLDITNLDITKSSLKRTQLRSPNVQSTPI